MTAPKDRGRRLGFPGKPAQQHDLVAELRFSYLTALAAAAPACLTELLAADVDLDAWAHRWGLACAWGHRAATATRAQHRDAGIAMLSLDVEDEAGGWVADAIAEDARGYREPRHVAWLVAYQTGRSFSSIAREAEVDVQTVHEACRRLATDLDVPMRPSRRGRPRRNPIS